MVRPAVPVVTWGSSLAGSLESPTLMTAAPCVAGWGLASAAGLVAACAVGVAWAGAGAAWVAWAGLAGAWVGWAGGWGAQPATKASNRTSERNQDLTGRIEDSLRSLHRCEPRP